MCVTVIGDHWLWHPNWRYNLWCQWFDHRYPIDIRHKQWHLSTPLVCFVVLWLNIRYQHRYRHCDGCFPNRQNYCNIYQLPDYYWNKPIKVMIRKTSKWSNRRRFRHTSWHGWRVFGTKLMGYSNHAVAYSRRLHWILFVASMTCFPNLLHLIGITIQIKMLWKKPLCE